MKHTFPLLSLAAALTKDERYQDALFEYMKEERGHDKWILDDIRALGGNADKVANGKPDMSCEIMVGYAYYAIEHISPYAILGMVHVLEGLSTMLAHSVATRRQGLARSSMAIKDSPTSYRTARSISSMSPCSRAS